ncbi:MAG TPA: hypothetical protein DDY58_16455 [Terrisporobacter glycolicus]|uniref:5-bromo-4-chloroindolyl phosphate hydrolysis protein n=1 Tax=Terrisporobacter hibernicus TaxID=2813371 RepID=A0AAX2ZJ68_9FIRM|nr:MULTISPECIES: hypothetical protein [Terrisporobacter]UEL49368.1 hypothetical protein JW646_07965 [Terrisporobacter hibernicus]SFJ54705.1 hypothetical protein SAMN02910355_3095 [Terrisporobacter glycolicus]HBI93882.1 hypothetical protein [Terrisporobacter hibernicus]
MRWILVFILLYLIPLTVLFKNYKSFKRACIYGSIYIVLSTTMVITNIYLSGLRVLEDTLDFEDDLVLETYLDQHNTQTIYNKQDIKKSDLQKIDEFKKDIYSIERIALIPMRECLPYTNNLQKGLENLTQIKDDVVYAKEMCEDVVEIYDNMKVPTLSKDEYTQILDRAKVNVRKTYELRTLAMESSSNLIDTKNPIYINKITEYLKLSDKEITSFKNKINELKETIKEE